MWSTKILITNSSAHSNPNLKRKSRSDNKTDVAKFKIVWQHCKLKKDRLSLHYIFIMQVAIYT